MSRTAAFAGKQRRVYELGDGALGFAVANIHYAAAKVEGIEMAYIPRKLQRGELRTAFLDLCPGASGFVVTAPFKTEILMLMDHIDNDARTIGAVNMITCVEGSSTGFNTDWLAIFRVLRRLGLRPDTNRSLVVGTGGAARASLYALWKLGFTRMTLAGRNHARSEAIAKGLGFVMGADVVPVPFPIQPSDAELSTYDVMVNATPLGRNGEDPLAGIEVPQRTALVDLTLSASETPLVRRSGTGRRIIVTGSDIAAEEASLDVRAWAGKVPLEGAEGSASR
ncbi:MAG TPA: hypothetical protein VMS77_02530 [Conexivisphaerales archaeon]|nr:hypothetical protein [Conexivisphaerales archaeon]